MKRPLKGWWTVLFNILAASPLLLDAILATLTQAEVQALIPAHLLPYYGLAVTAANIWLRSITDTPIGQGGDDA